jgi:hypothetical protein
MPQTLEAVQTIQLTQGKVDLVSACDYLALSSFMWHANYDPHTRSFRAGRRANINGKLRSIPMGRQILGLQPGGATQADHAKHDTLDCEFSAKVRDAI